MTIEERLGCDIAFHWDRNYDSEEGKMAQELARWLLDNYEIHKKLIFDF